MSFPKLSSRNKRRLKTSRNNVVEKQKRVLSNTQFQTVQQNEKKYWEKGTIGPQKKRHEKVHEKVKRVKIDIALNATAMEDNDFSSASAGPWR